MTNESADRKPSPVNEEQKDRQADETLRELLRQPNYSAKIRLLASQGFSNKSISMILSEIRGYPLSPQHVNNVLQNPLKSPLARKQQEEITQARQRLRQARNELREQKKLQREEAKAAKQQSSEQKRLERATEAQRKHQQLLQKQASRAQQAEAEEVLSLLKQARLLKEAEEHKE